MGKIVTKKGRITALRYFGNFAFGFIDGKISFSLRKDALGDKFTSFKNSFHVGDSIELTGIMMKKFGDVLIEVTAI
jgi:lysyl-tRNA synthetase class II